MRPQGAHSGSGSCSDSVSAVRRGVRTAQACLRNEQCIIPADGVTTTLIMGRQHSQQNKSITWYTQTTPPIGSKYITSTAVRRGRQPRGRWHDSSQNDTVNQHDGTSSIYDSAQETAVSLKAIQIPSRFRRRSG